MKAKVENNANSNIENLVLWNRSVHLRCITVNERHGVLGAK
jgi:hypothetical protein